LSLTATSVILGVDGVSDFNSLYSGKHNDEVQFYEFDVLAMDGDDCPSSDDLRLIRRFEKGGSGSSWVRV